MAKPPEPTLDVHGYPSLSSLRHIRRWDAVADPRGLVQFVGKLWTFPDGFRFNEHTGELELHTLGWSGNEEIIACLQENHMFWSLYWQKSERGGHYWFSGKPLVGG